MAHRALLILLLIAPLVPATLRATVIVPAEFREVVNGSDVIAHGLVLSTVVEPVHDRRPVETLVTLRVGTYLKGGPGDTLVFKVPGGQVGRYRTVFVGAPQLQAGDEVVVFLTAGGEDHPTVFGLNQGVFRVARDSRTSRRIVIPAGVLARTAGPERVVRGSAARRPVSLETFGAQVQTVLADSVRSPR